MKRIFIIHGWGGSPGGDWFPWLKNELTKKELHVIVPKMPDSLHPKIKDWVGFLAESVGEVDEDTYFIGHSIGCQTILRYLESLPEGKKIGGAILVAGWIHLTDETWDEDYTPKIAAPWMDTPINFGKICSHTNKFVVIQSDDDPYVPLSDAKVFEKELNAEIIVEHKKGHICAEDGVTELPSALSAISMMVG